MIEKHLLRALVLEVLDCVKHEQMNHVIMKWKS